MSFKTTTMNALPGILKLKKHASSEGLKAYFQINYNLFMFSFFISIVYKLPYFTMPVVLHILPLPWIKVSVGTSVNLFRF